MVSWTVFVWSTGRSHLLAAPAEDSLVAELLPQDLVLLPAVHDHILLMPDAGRPLCSNAFLPPRE
jgi:hypothetical protein